MTISNNYPTVATSLNLDFANSQQLDPRITFSRPTTAAYYDANTTALAEQNSWTYSQSIGGTNWVLSNTTVTLNSVVAPDGTTTASTLLETATTSTHYVGNTTSTIGAISGNSYTASVYAKQLNNQYFQITFGSTAFSSTQYATFDLVGGLVASSSGGTAAITSVGNGWYRCSWTATATATATDTAYLLTANYLAASRLPSYLGNVANGVYLWGAQLEQRSSVTAYNATTTTAITNYIPVLLTAPTNQARFDHDPVARTSLGLLIEQQSTNLILQSQNLSSTPWSVYVAAPTYDAIVTPDGSLSNSLLNDTNTTSYSGVLQTISISASTTYTFSCYVKQGSSTAGFCIWLLGSGGNTFFQSTIAWTGGIPTASGWTAAAVGNGWYRILYTFSSSTSTSITIYLLPAIQSTSAIGSTAFWGAQLEALAFPTSYIPTQASQVTRSADSASMTGTNFSSWYSSGQGTLYGEADTIPYNSALSGGITIAGIDNETANNQFGIRYTTGGTYVSGYVTFNGTFPASGNQFVSNTGFNKLSLTYQGSLNVFDTGGTAVISNTGTYPSFVPMTRLTIGNTNGAGYLNGTIKKIAFYPIAVTSANLIALTGS